MMEGVKEITIDNWDKPDSIIFAFDPEGKNIYLERILNITLNESVPASVRNLFEVARNSMIYGYFYYPLYTLSAEQMHRVGECAVKKKARQIKSEISEKATFDQCIKLLKENNILDDNTFNKWDGVRNLRNHSSHPNEYMLLPTEMLIQYVNNFAKEINKLFQDDNL